MEDLGTQDEYMSIHRHNAQRPLGWLQDSLEANTYLHALETLEIRPDSGVFLLQLLCLPQCPCSPRTFMHQPYPAVCVGDPHLYVEHEVTKALGCQSASMVELVLVCFLSLVAVRLVCWSEQ